ncbi:DUF1614 domain-containing protein [Thermoanaerobacterium thermosaccharolyticum]|jgi:hypothetical protein|uniref:DUF1614 domain-containing protein n=1 Tax=Thermoanaerobacterium thermosaccharolyticum TaxID=1517 RepID=UPI0010499391|nr:DUF1614 domain-containing protein [Thermoanaerobacterium thermosaccharolyticum]KAA5807241.1 DUF1614 domain-containing protein [Thermoanaerobacterium thermosaccharolyticum]MBE0069034.1 DUF1614 domain-containing protein [Thermoanaerobacterium thermosaccharolyticum]MBE0227626.1 DUF1614 domain-containing protein [Thermoanaerobacterium thermosaccharolyticum]TCW36128.1 uncharacterized protein DUF1614 [Thermohydrogenium kirishiense]
MPLAYIILSITGLFVLFGFAHRVLDRMKMTDTWALIIIIGMIIGTFLPAIPLGKKMSINIGGAIIPAAVAVYLFIKAERGSERRNALVSSILAGTAVFLAGRLLPSEPEAMFIEPNYVYGIVSGLIAYLFGRSRRCAFIAGVMGVILSDITQGLINIVLARPGTISVGGAGAFDTVVISMIVAVFFSEILGETREKIQGGTAKKNTEPHLTSSLLSEDEIKAIKEKYRKKDSDDDEK